MNPTVKKLLIGLPLSVVFVLFLPLIGYVLTTHALARWAWRKLQSRTPAAAAEATTVGV